MSKTKLEEILLKLLNEEYFLFIIDETPNKKHEQYGYDYIDLYAQVAFSRKTAMEYYNEIKQYKDLDDIEDVFGKYFEMTGGEREFELVMELMNQLVNSSVYEMEMEDLLNERHKHSDFSYEIDDFVRAETIYEGGGFRYTYETKKEHEDRLYHVFNWKIKYEQGTIVEKFELENKTGRAIERIPRTYG